MLEWLKEHKLWIAGGVAILVIVLYLRGGSSGTGDYTAGSTADTASADGLQQAMIAANSQASQNATALQAQSEHDAANVALAQIQAHTSDNANSLSAQVASLQIAAAQHSSELHDTLSAQVADSTLKAQSQNLATSAAAQAAQLSMVTTALVHSADVQAGVQSQQIKAAEHVQTQSWLSKFLG